MALKILSIDKYLAPYKKDLELRMENYNRKKQELLPDGGTLADFANGYLYFGIHRTPTG